MKSVKVIYDLPAGVTENDIESHKPDGYHFHSVEQYPLRGGGMRSKIIYTAPGVKSFIKKNKQGYDVKVFAETEAEAVIKALKMKF